MARDHTITATCDVHAALLHMDDEPATKQRIIPLGAVPRRVDVCDHCDLMPMWRQLEDLWPWLSVVWEHGVDIEEPKATRQPVPEPVPEPVPVPEPAPAVQAIEPPKKGKSTKDKLYVICPRNHYRKEGPQRVLYDSRNSHADNTHHVKVWDIEWKYPGGTEWFPCEVHKECLAVKLRFPSLLSVVRHMASVDLERIDK